MKNIQIIDDAINCAYDVYSISDEDFNVIFHEPGQNVEFIEDLEARIGTENLEELHRRIWQRRIKKESINGIHGTLFYQMDYKKEFYPNKIDIQ